MEQHKGKVEILCNHPLSYTDLVQTISKKCDGCGQGDGNGIYCYLCNFNAHLQCINFPQVINYPCHSRHPLKLVSAESIQHPDGRCHICRKELSGPTFDCSMCNFSIDPVCWKNPPPLTIYQPKRHNHTFNLIAIRVSFTCNACGMVGERNPYVCLPCNFMVHQECIDLPRVIEINRHDHRVFRTYELQLDGKQCGVCRKKVDWSFGAFSCWRCPNYAVHSKCATRKDVWDGKELEDERDCYTIEAPYKVEHGTLYIIHYSHAYNGHLLIKNRDYVAPYYGTERCHGCIGPINSNQFFKCTECSFELHEECVNLPRLKRNILHNYKLTVEKIWPTRLGKRYAKCKCCLRFFDGFKYECKVTNSFWLDVRCAFISEPFDHELHPHPLYRTTTEPKTCGGCGKKSEYVLNCIVCEYALGMECATLPRKVKHRCHDDHDLILQHGIGNSKGDLWCDICETKTDPSVWFYGCEDCEVTLHIECVIHDMYYLIPRYNYYGRAVISNDGMTRPFCITCKKRCMFSSYFRHSITSRSTFLYTCSMKCKDDS